jgi:hypothetical protein
MSRWLRRNERAQILLTLELIGLPATALIAHGVRRLGSGNPARLQPCLTIAEMNNGV